MNIAIDKIDRSGLVPQKHVMPNGKVLAFFPDNNTELVKIDFCFPAGAAYQSKLLQAAATNSLLCECSKKRSIQEVAEWIDFRGIVVDKNVDTVMSTLSFYTLRRYVPELLPLVYELFAEPVFGEHEFAVFLSKRRQKILSAQMETGKVARNLFYADIFGRTHPYGVYAEVEDVDKLTVDDVRRFYSEHYNLSQMQMVVAGHCDARLVELIDKQFGQVSCDEQGTGDIFEPADYPIPAHETFRAVNAVVPNAVQSTLRIGRRLPWRWDSQEYALFTVLNTLLGGYFGSRLMSNIREGKGYTYGIYSYSHLMRDNLLFFINTDVGSQYSQPALKEIYKEMERLCNEPVDAEELEVVRHYLVGDFLRSIDGIFERGERYRSMQTSRIDERFTDNFFHAIATCTPQQLQAVARQAFDRDAFTQVVVGQESIQ